MSNTLNKTESNLQSQQGNNRDLNGDALDFLGDQKASLAWTSSGQNIIISGGSDITQLSGLRGALLSLKSQFFSQKEAIVIQGDRKNQLDRRLLLLQHQIDGLMKRKINYSVKDSQGPRILDYSNILNQKENQIVQLQNKIKNLEERLRRASKREDQLENQIVQLRTAIKEFNSPNVTRQDLEHILIGANQYRDLDQKYVKLRAQWGAYAGLVRTQLHRFRQNGIKIDFDSNLNQLSEDQGIEISVVNGCAQIIHYKDKVVEVTVQDSRTKHLIHLLAIQMKKYHDKYPKLKEQIDVRLSQFFQQEIIDCIDVDEIDRIVSVVKYVPEFYRVENVYAYNSAKQRRIEFHLRVLIKALLEELEKIKRRTGVVLEIDQGVIGMINQEIITLIDVDDILKVFRVVSKIVQVEKIVQKIVERVVEIPQVCVVERIVEKIVQVIKIQQVEKIIHVPVEIIKYVDNIIEKIIEVPSQRERIVEVPRIVQKIVERIIQIPKVVTVQVFVDRIIEVEKPTIVEKIVNHIITEIKQIEVIKEKIVIVEKIIREIVEVEIIKEKIVERIVEVIKPVEIIREKLVTQIEYRNVKEHVNHFIEIPQIVEVIIQKTVHFIQTVEKIVEVPQIVEKIIQVQVQVIKFIEVKVIEEKIVYVTQIKEVERVNNVVVTLIKEVEKIVERRVQIPIIQERIVRVPEINTLIVVERIQIPNIIEIIRYVDKIVEVTKIVEVEKPVNHYITQHVPVTIIVEKIVEVPRTIERIKQVRVHIDRIIEKMVELPKVVEVERIVQRIVIIPRIVEKIVEIPQIVERIVERMVQVEIIRQVERIVQVAVIQEKILEVQVIKNIYNQVEKIIQIIVEKIVPFETLVQTIKIVKEQSQKIVQVRVEVPKEIQVEKIVYMYVEVEKVIQVYTPTVVTVQVFQPIDRIIQKPVYYEKTVIEVVQVPQIIEKIVGIQTEIIKIEEVINNIQKAVKYQVYKQIEKQVPYQKVINRETQVFVDKLVTVNNYIHMPIQQIIIEKMVQVPYEVTKIHEVERVIDKVIKVPQIVQLRVDNYIIVKTNQIVQSFRDRPIQIPLIHQEIISVPTFEEKIVVVERIETEIIQVIVNRDRIVTKDNIIIKTDINNYIQTKLQIVDRFQQKIITVHYRDEKIIEVPYLLQKIVEKIVIMPQVVEVIKYVHEIIEEASLGVAIGGDIQEADIRYQQIYRTVRVHLDAVLVQLRTLKVQTPNLKIQIDIIEVFLIELDKLIQFPRFYQVEKETIIEKEVKVGVLVPSRDSESIRNELALSVLVDKLLGQLRIIKKKDPNYKCSLDEETQLIFLGEALGKGNLSEDLSAQLRSYKESQYSKLLGIGKTWSTDHQLIVSTILEERFTMANIIQQANLQIQKSKSIADCRLDGYRQIKQSHVLLQSKLDNFERQFVVVAKSLQQNSKYSKELSLLLTSIGDIKRLMTGNMKGVYIEEPMFFVGDIHGDNDSYIRIQSAFRTLERENDLLRDKYVKWQKEMPNPSALFDQERVITDLRNIILDLTSQIASFKSQSALNINLTDNTQQYQIKIRTLKSIIQQSESQLRRQKIDFEGQIRNKSAIIRELQQKLVKLQDSRVAQTNFGQSPNVDILTSSVHSNSSSSQERNSSSVSSSSGQPTTSTYAVTSQTQPTTSTYEYGNNNTAIQPIQSSTISQVSYGNSRPPLSFQSPTSEVSYGSSRAPRSFQYGATGATGTTGGTNDFTKQYFLSIASLGGSRTRPSYATTGTPATYGTAGTSGVNYGAISGPTTTPVTYTTPGMLSTSGLGTSGISGTTGFNYGTSGTAAFSATHSGRYIPTSGTTATTATTATTGTTGITGYTPFYNRKL